METVRMKYEYISVFVIYDIIFCDFTCNLDRFSDHIVLYCLTVWLLPTKRHCICTKHVLECNSASTYQSHKTLATLLWYQGDWIHVVCCLCNSISHCWTGWSSAEFPLTVLSTADGWSYASLFISSSVRWVVESLLRFGMKLGFLYYNENVYVLPNRLGKWYKTWK